MKKDLVLEEGVEVGRIVIRTEVIEQGGEL